jgi:RNA polymerase sigma-70 factor (ECF subfamily)
LIVTTEEILSKEVSVEHEAESPPGPAEWSESAFETIFLEHYARVVAVLFRVVGDRARAEELADDVFWKIYRQPLPVGREHNVGGWLYRAATRLGLDALRAAARRRRYEQAAAINGVVSDAAIDPLDKVLRAEKRHRVREALAQIKPAQAQLLILRHSGLSYQELAQALGVKASSIGTLLARAETEFEKRYRELPGDEEKS